LRAKIVEMNDSLSIIDTSDDQKKYTLSKKGLISSDITYFCHQRHRNWKKDGIENAKKRLGRFFKNTDLVIWKFTLYSPHVRCLLKTGRKIRLRITIYWFCGARTPIASPKTFLITTNFRFPTICENFFIPICL